jgi:23S rRNA (adenine2030-N6)-methyltransferase
MNYRHHFHAGNFADVVKHALLVALVRALQQKPKGFLYVDTHAGRGGYDLAVAATGDTLARAPEWPDGIGRLGMGSDARPDSVTEYLDVVRQFDRARGNQEEQVRYYPGSPWIVRLLARSQDRLALCEMHPGEATALREEIGSGRDRPDVPAVSVQEMDGYVGVRALLPPVERRALILIDPPYEAQDEYVRAADGLAEGLRRFPSGVFALWYPLTQRSRAQEFLTQIVALEPPPTLVAELAIAGDASPRKMRGCGLAIVNPPWRFDGEARAVLSYLTPLLAQDSGADFRVDWLVPER